MLNTISDLKAAAEAREPFGAGACLPSAVDSAAQPRKGTVAPARPRACWAVDASGLVPLATGLGGALGRRNPGQQYPHTTRIAVASGGAEGPHPAREPGPV